MNNLTDFLLELVIPALLTFVVVASYLNFTKLGNTTLRIAFGKQKISGKISFSKKKTLVFVAIMLLALFISIMLAKSNIWGIALMGIVSGLYISVIETQKRQEKQMG